VKSGKHVYRAGGSSAGVFVDGSGRRVRWTQRVIRLFVVGVLALVALVLISVLGGVPLPGLTHPVPLPSNEPAGDRGAPLALAEGPAQAKNRSETTPSAATDPRGVDGLAAPSHPDPIRAKPGRPSRSSDAGAPPVRLRVPGTSASVPADQPTASRTAPGRPGGTPGSPVTTSRPSPTRSVVPTTAPVATPSSPATSSGHGGRPTTPPGHARTRTRTVGATPTPGPKSTHPVGGPKSTHPGGGSPTAKPSHTPRPHATPGLRAVAQ
jgi:hypothetical protein